MLLPSLETLLWMAARKDSGATAKMNVHNLLNTDNRSPAAPEPRTMQFEQSPQQLTSQHHDLTTSDQYTHRPASYDQSTTQQPSLIKIEPKPETLPALSQSQDSTQFSSQAPSLQSSFAQSHQEDPQQSGTLPHDYSFEASSIAQSQLPLLPNSYTPPSTDEYDRAQLQHLQHHQIPPDMPDLSMRPSTGNSLPKSFACSSCGKGFARRSDLARHERIHSGDRPHVCEYPGCGKQFIQRSALTVHSRVHTGEKPHMCECCAKHFSDSSSLARHRRTHSGKRPYKCPYQSCQKTFTRRTTLTRHSLQHSGTVEESALATATTLASKANSLQNHNHNQSDNSELDDSRSTNNIEGHPSAGSSPHDTSISFGSQPRPSSEYLAQAINGGIANMPPHMRPEMGVQMSRPSSPSSTQSYVPVSSNRSSMSHPATYSLPNTVDSHGMPTSLENSAAQSPSMPGSGWQSPAQRSLPIAQPEDYAYPDPHTQQYVQNAQNLYYHNTQTDPMQRLSQELWSAQQ